MCGVVLWFQGALQELEYVKEELEGQRMKLREMDKLLLTCENRRDSYMVELHFSQNALSSSTEKVLHLENLLKRGNCTLLKSDAAKYKQVADTCTAAKEDLDKKINLFEEKISKLTKDQEKLFVTEEKLQIAENNLKATQIELESTKSALTSLVASLDSHLQYQELKEHHEKEVLPFWLERSVQRLLETSKHFFAREIQPNLRAIHMHMKQRYMGVQKVIRDIKSGFDFFMYKVWSEHVQPAIFFLQDMCLTHIPGWRDISQATRQHYHKFIEVKIYLSFKTSQNYKKISMDMERAIVDKMKRSSVLQPYATRRSAMLVFHAALLSIVAPLLYLLVHSVLRLALYLFRPGTSVVNISNESKAVQEVESSIHYSFRDRDLLIQALEGSKKLYKLGNLVLDLISEDSSLENHLEVINEQSTSSQIANMVKEGPGIRSRSKARRHRLSLLVSLYGAMFKDSCTGLDSVKMCLSNLGNSVERKAGTVVENETWDKNDDEQAESLGPSRSASEEKDCDENAVSVKEEDNINE